MIRVLVEIKMNTKPVNERKDYHTMVLEALLFYNIAQKYNVFAIYMLTDKPVISRNLHKGFYNLVEFKQKADHISAKVLLADFGDQIHIAKVNDRYVLMIEADTLTFEKGFSN